jgi:DNA-binding HxlR family transcriptional regulator
MQRDLKAAPPGDAQVPSNGNGAIARRAFELVGMRWNGLIVAEVLGGTRRFTELQQSLDIPTALLAHRLSMLVAHGVLERRPCGRADRCEYWPTDKGRDLHPVLLALASWGERHGSAPAPPAVTHNGNGNGNGNGSATRRALEFAGLPWNLLILAEVHGGVHRFKQLQREGQIPRKTLARRLSMLVSHGVLERRCYDESRRDRHEYWATDKGRGLYPALDALIRWGDRYMPPDQQAALNN